MVNRFKTMVNGQLLSLFVQLIDGNKGSQREGDRETGLLHFFLFLCVLTFI